MKRSKVVMNRSKVWIGFCDCGITFRTSNADANFNEAIDHVLKKAHNVQWRLEDTGWLTPSNVAKHR